MKLQIAVMASGLLMAAAAPAQNDLAHQIAASAQNPMSAWVTAFTPNMRNNLRPLTVVDQLPENCSFAVEAKDDSGLKADDKLQPTVSCREPASDKGGLSGAAAAAAAETPRALSGR